LGAQFVQASQFVFEELLLHDFDAPALVVVGMEGVWGLVISVCMSIPLCWYLPGDDVGGHYENFEDSGMRKLVPQFYPQSFTSSICLLRTNQTPCSCQNGKLDSSRPCDACILGGGAGLQCEFNVLS
jgi:hypothetical protein